VGLPSKKVFFDKVKGNIKGKSKEYNLMKKIVVLILLSLFLSPLALHAKKFRPSPKIKAIQSSLSGIKAIRLLAKNLTKKRYTGRAM